MKTAFQFSAVVLAGGRSSRMGTDKAQLLFDGQPLWKRQLATLLATGAGEVFVSGPPFAASPAEPGQEAPPVPGLKFVSDERPGLGPLAGIASALTHARYDLLLVLAIDLPEMRPWFLRGLLAECGGRARALRDGRGFEPLAALYSRECLPLIQQHLSSEDRSLQSFLRAAMERGLITTRLLTADEQPLFLNMNSPGDAFLKYEV